MLSLKMYVSKKLLVFGRRWRVENRVTRFIEYEKLFCFAVNAVDLHNSFSLSLSHEVGSLLGKYILNSKKNGVSSKLEQ